MSFRELIKRYLLFVISLLFTALGVAVTKHGELGVSPTSSVANVLSSRFSVLCASFPAFIPVFISGLHRGNQGRNDPDRPSDRHCGEFFYPEIKYPTESDPF